MRHSASPTPILERRFPPVTSREVPRRFVGRGCRGAVRLKPTSGNGGRAMAMVYVITAGSGESYRIERVYLDGDQAYRFAQDYNGIAPVEPVQVEEWQDGAPPSVYDGPYWRAEWWARMPVAKRRGALRAHRRGRTVRRLRHPPGVVDRGGIARGHGGAPGTGRGTEDRGGRACRRRRWRSSSGTRSPRSGPTWRASRGNNFRYLVRQMERNGHSDSTLPSSCVMIDAWTDAPWNGSATTS